MENRARNMRNSVELMKILNILRQSDILENDIFQEAIESYQKGDTTKIRNIVCMLGKEHKNYKEAIQKLI